MRYILSLLMLCALLLSSANTNAVVITYNLAENSADSTVGSVRTTAYPSGDAPISGASCSTLTCVNPLTGEIDEISATEYDFVSNSVNGVAPDYAYERLADSGDIQVEVQLPATYGSGQESNAACGVFIYENLGASDYVAYAVLRNDGLPQLTYGARDNTSTLNGASTSLGKKLFLNYDVSATELNAYHTTDEVTFIQIGSSIDKTLSCDGGNCYVGVQCTSHDSGKSTNVTVTEYDSSTTITTGSGTPSPDPENIIWEGDVENGSFEEWHFNSDEAFVQFSNVPPYGRPPNYSNGNHTQTQTGDGSLLDIVTSPVRVGTNAIRFRTKNSANGSEPADLVSGDSSTRRSQLQDSKFTVSTDLSDTSVSNAIIPNGAERWVTFSVYLPSNFPTQSTDGFFTVWGMKGSGTVGSSGYSAPIQGWIGLQINGESWQIRDTWMADGQGSNASYWYQIFYNTAGCVWTGCNIQLPNFTTSTTALGDLNRGGWTDFVFHWLTDTTANADQEADNNGFLNVYMRTDSASWVHVLEALPQNDVEYGGVSNSYDKGIGVTGAYYTQMSLGIYADKGTIWEAPVDTELVIDNIKVGDANASCVDMTHDGTDCTQ